MESQVLIVEDDHATRLLLEAILTRNGIPCDHASDGAIALRKIAQEQFGAILLDLLLPVMNGFEILRDLKNSRPEILPHIIVITAAADSTWRSCEEIRLVYCVLRKPLDISDLIGHVRGCMAAQPLASDGQA